jgi:hypothetical protein
VLVYAFLASWLWLGYRLLLPPSRLVEPPLAGFCFPYLPSSDVHLGEQTHLAVVVVATTDVTQSCHSCLLTTSFTFIVGAKKGFG